MNKEAIYENVDTILGFIKVVERKEFFGSNVIERKKWYVFGMKIKEKSECRQLTLSEVFAKRLGLKTPQQY